MIDIEKDPAGMSGYFQLKIGAFQTYVRKNPHLYGDFNYDHRLLSELCQKVLDLQQENELLRDQHQAALMNRANA